MCSENTNEISVCRLKINHAWSTHVIMRLIFWIHSHGSETSITIILDYIQYYCTYR
jgi:hypothetical protein